MLVLEHAGTDLEHSKLKTWKQAKSLLGQAVASLSIAERVSIKFGRGAASWTNKSHGNRKLNSNTVIWFVPTHVDLGRIYNI